MLICTVLLKSLVFVEKIYFHVFTGSVAFKQIECVIASIKIYLHYTCYVAQMSEKNDFFWIARKKISYFFNLLLNNIYNSFVTNEAYLVSKHSPNIITSLCTPLR